MNFDEFDAPQFVDFSQENFDASQDGDSWFSNDSNDIEVGEVEDETECQTHWIEAMAQGLPSWLHKPSNCKLPVLTVDAQSVCSIPPDSVLFATSRGATASIEMAKHDDQSNERAAAAPAHPAATTGPVARGRQTTMRSSPYSHRRLSLASSRVAEARRKAAQRAREWNRTPAKIERDGESTPAKRLRTDEKPKRRIAVGKASAIDPALPRPKPKPIFRVRIGSSTDDSTLATPIGNDGGNNGLVATAAAVSSIPAIANHGNQRKRARDLDSGGAKVDQPRAVIQFSAKNALGAKQTFRFGANRQVTTSSTSLPSSSSTSGNSDVLRFHARPAPSSSSNCFQPNLGRGRSIEVKEFHFYTKDRAQARRELDAIKAETNERLRKLEDKRRREEAEKERAELKRLREALVHKPTPINHGQPFIVSASARKLTNPESPNLSYKQNKRDS